jgi:peroxiredoxin
VPVAPDRWRPVEPRDNTFSDVTAAPGIWRGWLALPDGAELSFNFDFDFRRDADRNPIYLCHLINAHERTPAAVIPSKNPTEDPSLGFSFGAARIEGSWGSRGVEMRGEYIYTRDGPDGPVEYRLPFRALNGDSRRFDEPDLTEPAPPAELPTRWRVSFERREGPAVATLRLLPDGRSVVGTIMTPTGDDGLLAGVFVGGRLRLSRFTGDSGILYDATLQPDGSLIGTYSSLAHHRESFTAVPDAEARLPDLFGLTRWNPGVSPAGLTFRDTTGQERRLDEFLRGPAIVYVFGTWCHNCADATAALNDLHARYADRGLSIVGLSFEADGSFEERARTVAAYRDARGVPFPLLVAGGRDKDEATRTLAALDRVRAYPTMAFIDGSGTVVGVLQGFVGPAAPQEHAALQRSVIDRVESMLAGS